MQRLQTKVLTEADRLINGERRDQYGTPEESFQKIADLWSAYLGFTITPSDVCAMMILLKTARISNKGHHEDSWIDIAGYAALGDVVGRMQLEE